MVLALRLLAMTMGAAVPLLLAAPEAAAARPSAYHARGRHAQRVPHVAIATYRIVVRPHATRRLHAVRADEGHPAMLT